MSEAATPGGDARDPRAGLVSAAVLVVAGWVVTCVGVGRSSFPVVVAVVLAGAVLIGAGVVLGWRTFVGSRYVITPVARSRRFTLTMAAVLLVLSALPVGYALTIDPASPFRSGVGWMIWLGIPGCLVFQALGLLAMTVLLVGGPRGLTFWRRQALGFTRVPWSDIERVVFSNRPVPDTIEIGVALRSGAKLRRSSTRRHDVLTDLPCRVVVYRKSFDFAGLQRLLAAHPGIALVERSAGMERVWSPAVQTRP